MTSKELGEEIIKYLKVLYILKRTKLDLWDFKFDMDSFERSNYEWYSNHYSKYSYEKLSREDFDLIKEWLNEQNDYY